MRGGPNGEEGTPLYLPSPLFFQRNTSTQEFGMKLGSPALNFMSSQNEKIHSDMICKLPESAFGEYHGKNNSDGRKPGNKTNSK
jgi:hypothetical protein